MLTCIVRPKQPSDESLNQQDETNQNGIPHTKQTIRNLTSQIKDIALKASGTYRQCNPCSGQLKQGKLGELDGVGSERFQWSFRRTTSSNSTTGRWGKELEARLKGISSGGEGLPGTASCRRVDPVVFVEEKEPKEWVAQVEPGVLITFVSLPRGGNDLKRIRFSREMFNKWQAQRWWAENYEKVMELYNVQQLNREAFPLPTPPRSKDENSKAESAEESPITPPLSKERLAQNLNRPTGTGMGLSSSSSLEQPSTQSRHYCESHGVTSTSKLSTINGTNTETHSSTMDASNTTSSSRDVDRSGEQSVSNAGDLETDWVEQDEPGVYITIRAHPDGRRELRRVRFSRDKFGEIHARLWWEENRARIYKRYL